MNKDTKNTGNLFSLPTGGGGNIDAVNHVTGSSVYVDDIPVMEGALFVKVFDSPLAHGKINKLDFSAAEKLDGIVKIFWLCYKAHNVVACDNQNSTGSLESKTAIVT